MSEPTMTAQELFDTVWTALVRQGCKSADNDDACLYRGPNGTKCAAGHILTDAEVEQLGEGVTVQQWNVPSRLAPHLKLLKGLQQAHDAADELPTWLDDFKRRAQKVAAEFELTVPGDE